jgi:hypothetical protein
MGGLHNDKPEVRSSVVGSAGVGAGGVKRDEEDLTHC